jgi:peptidoglycan hydrolase-like protein with peptidoglycan-binding domain
MKTLVVIFAALSLIATAAPGQGDPAISSVQQSLKDQGFYYGEINGKKDADTTAAIRRYQIRNGLQVTGDLNAETRKSLGVKGGATTTPAARATPPAIPRQPAPQPRVQPTPEPADTSDLRDDAALDDETAYADDDAETTPARPPTSSFVPGPRELAPDMTGIFDGTPFEIAPPDVQRRVIAGAQTVLMRLGYYRSGIDGIYGPNMAFALRAYQSRHDLEPNGQLDLETLGSLGLLPGQQARGMQSPRRRVWRPSIIIEPRGEPVYIPR